jgi:hypothetical protein
MHTKFQVNPNRFGHSNMAKITASLDFQYRTDFNYYSYTSSNVNQTWDQLVWTLSQDIYPFNPLAKGHIMNLFNTNQSKLDY